MHRRRLDENEGGCRAFSKTSAVLKMVNTLHLTWLIYYVTGHAWLLVANKLRSFIIIARSNLHDYGHVFDILCHSSSKLMNEPVCLGVCEHMLCRWVDAVPLGVANLVEADCCTLLCLLFYYPEVINDLWFFVLTTRSCAGPQAGEGCVVCHSPAWVKDIRINRQLSNITELYGNLDSLLNPTGSDYSGMLLLENKNNCIVHWLEWKCFYCFSQHPQIIIL